jgi:hypothetical protein
MRNVDGLSKRAYLDVVLHANPDVFEEVYKMSDSSAATFDDFLMRAGFIARWEEKGREKDIKNLLEFGMPPDQVSAALKIPLTQVFAAQGQPLYDGR